MANPDFSERPILNSPYVYPSSHWELDEQGQPTGNMDWKHVSNGRAGALSFLLHYNSSKNDSVHP